MTDIGRAIFFDVSLSASGKVACASCHDPEHAFGPPNDLPVQRGGGDGQRYGVRAVPSLKYMQNVPSFTEHYFDDDGDDGIDQGPGPGAAPGTVACNRLMIKRGCRCSRPSRWPTRAPRR